MVESHDDFEWIVRALRGARAPRRSGRETRTGYESVDQIFERRTASKEKRKRLMVLLAQMIPLVIVLLWLLLA